MNDFERIKSQVKIMDIMGHYTNTAFNNLNSKELRTNPCPLCGHNDCFTVYLEDNRYHCFSCKSNGDIFNFVANLKRIDTAAALHEIAAITRIPLTKPGQLNGQPADKSLELRKQIFNDAAAFYRAQLLKDAKVLKILQEERQYSKDFLAQAPIGYTGNRSNLLKTHLSKKYSRENLLKSGLFSEKDDQWFDFFGSQYLVFFHLDGNQVSDFSLKDAFKKKRKEPRKEYRLRAEHRIGDVCYFNQNGLSGSEVILVEGENDVLQLWNLHRGAKDGQQKLSRENPVGAKAFSDEKRLQLLRKKLKGKTIYLAFDNDDAGLAYAQKAFEALWENCSLKVLHWEPDAGKDIDEYLRRSADPVRALAELKASSIDAFAHQINQLPANTIGKSADLDAFNSLDPGRKTEALQPLVNIIAKVNDSFKVDVALEIIRETLDQAVYRLVLKRIRMTKDEQGIGSTDGNHSYFERTGAYYKRDKEHSKRISSFVLIIDEIYLLPEELLYSCTLVTEDGSEKQGIIFDARDRTDVNRFRMKTQIITKAHYWGNSMDLSGIWYYEECRCTPKQIKTFQQFGWIADEKIYIMGNCAFKDGKFYPMTDGYVRIEDINYKVDHVKVYGGNVPKINLEAEYSRQFAAEIAQAFHHIADGIGDDGETDGYKGYVLLGFLPAMLYLDDLFEECQGFPFLFLYGDKGTGKTTMLRFLLHTFGFLCQPATFSTATPDGIYKNLQALSRMPVWFSEYKNKRIREKPSLLEVIQNVFDRYSDEKGGRTMAERWIQVVNGMLWLDGNDIPEHEIILHRSVFMEFHDGIKSAGGKRKLTRRNAFSFLQENRQNLSLLLKQIMLEQSKERSRMLINETRRLYQYYVQQGVDDRIAKNHAIPIASLTLLNIDIPIEVEEYGLRMCKELMNRVFEESPTKLFFSDLSYLFGKGICDDYTWFETSGHYRKEDNEDFQGEILYVAVGEVLREIQEDYRKKGRMAEHSPYHTKRMLELMSAVIEKSYPKKIHKRTRRCWVFHYEKLDQGIKDSLESVRDRFVPPDTRARDPLTKV